MIQTPGPNSVMPYGSNGVFIVARSMNVLVSNKLAPTGQIPYYRDIMPPQVLLPKPVLQLPQPKLQDLLKLNEYLPAEGASVEELVESGNPLVEEVSNLVRKYDNYSDYSNAMKEIAQQTNKSSEEIIGEIHAVYNLSKDTIPDLLVVSDTKYLKDVPYTDGYLNIDWPESLGFDTDTMSSLERDNLLPNQWDRVGNMGGNNFTTIPDNGMPYSYDQRAIPYLENDSARHLGTFDNNLYFDSIDAIRSDNLEMMNTLLSNNGKDVISQVQFDDMIARYKKYELDLAKYIEGVDAPYGLKGVAASWTDAARYWNFNYYKLGSQLLKSQDN